MDVLGVVGVLGELPTDRPHLLSNLGRLRHATGPITEESADALADHMGIRRGEVHEVVSFYSYLRLPLDTVRVCTGPVCDCARGGAPLSAGEVEVPCLGHCELAPVALEGDEIAGGTRHTANDGPALGLGTRDETLADYERRGGLRALRSQPPPDRVIAELQAAGLSGYGGAGFPTARKWKAVLGEPGPRIAAVNADEGEPGTIKDRYVMELRPHLLVEGLLVASRTLDAAQAFVYIREEYALARTRLEAALDEFRAAGLLDGVAVEVVVGAGAYIAGEETAMLESMEGRRAMPRLKPPFPSEVGYLGRPTLIQNVETLAHVPPIVERGGAWWAALGEPGTRVFSVTGAVRRPGCYEAPNGVSTRTLVEEYAGGFAEEPGAIVPGGAASGILPPTDGALDAPLTRDGLAPFGAGPGSGAVQVFPASYPVLRLLAETLRFFAEESCGKCTPCRIGNRALRHVVERLADGEAAMPGSQVDEWLEALERTSICGLGQASPIPVRTVRAHWPDLFARL
jgi:formate dehydrogenase beta subunit